MDGDIAPDKLFEFIMTHSAPARAIRYREEAARFRRMAQTETNASLRQGLTALARQYTQCAEELAGSE
jgi:hypothetical protein